MKARFQSTDPVYQQYEAHLEARSTRDRIWTITVYFLPGILMALFINVRQVHDFFVGLFGTSSATYQFWLLIALSFGWHLVYPVWALRRRWKFNWRQVFEALSMHRFSAKGIFLITPLFFLLLMIPAVPYMKFVFPILFNFFSGIELFAIPEYSLFSDYSMIYGLASWQLTLLFIGNFLGEEIYFRGYLLKRSAFLGRHNWWIHSVLFSLYHLWQIPMTYSLTFLSLAFGWWMLKRQNLYELIALHMLINILMPVVVQLFS